MKFLFVSLVVLTILLSPATMPQPSAHAEGIRLMGPEHITPATEKAIDRGLKWLAANQSRDGSWSARGGRRYSVAMTSLAGVALLSSGSTPVEGEYAPNIRRAVDYVMKFADPNTGVISRPGEGHAVMHEHGFAMLFLGLVYGMERNPKQQERLRTVLEKAVELTAKTQSKAGGWLYAPNNRGDEGSTTVTQIQGIRAIRNAGVEVPIAVVEKAANYIEKCQQADGGISYRVGMRGSRPAISAAAVAVMYNAGEYDHPVALKCLDYMRNLMKKGRVSSVYGGHKYYGMLYASQAMYLASEEDWAWYFPQVRDELIRTQSENGGWTGDRVGDSYGTAIALITLQLEYAHLPIFQR